MTTLTLYLITGAFALGLISGIFLDHKFQLASETVQAQLQKDAAQKGETKIIHDTQIIYRDIKNANQKGDKCVGAVVPSAINSQLR